MNKSTTLIRSFADALDLAIYDKMYEQKGVEVNFFYDADVLYNLIMGFLA